MTDATKRTRRKLILGTVVAVLLVGVFAATAGAEVFGGPVPGPLGEPPEFAIRCFEEKLAGMAETDNGEASGQATEIGL